MNNYTNTFGMHIICVFLKRNNIKLPKYLAYKIIDYVQEMCSEKCILCQIDYLLINRIPFNIFQNNKKIFEFTMKSIKITDYCSVIGKYWKKSETYDKQVREDKYCTYYHKGHYIFNNKNRFALPTYNHTTHGNQYINSGPYIKKYNNTDVKKCVMKFGQENMAMASWWDPQTFIKIELFNNKFTMQDCIQNENTKYKFDGNKEYDNYDEIGEMNVNCTLDEIKLKLKVN